MSFRRPQDSDISFCLGAAQEELRSLLVWTIRQDEGSLYLLEELRSATLQDIARELVLANRHYEASGASPELLSAIAAFSQNLSCYSNIIEVFKPQHTEDAAIVWAAIQYLCRTFRKQTATALILLNGLCEVADALPKIDFSLHSHRTAVLNDITSIGRLYVHILKFLTRALQWHNSNTGYTNSPCKTLATLQFDDTILALQHDSEIVRILAARTSVTESTNVSHISDGQHELVQTTGHNYPTVYISGHANVQLGDQHHHHHQDVSHQLALLTNVVERLRHEIAQDRAWSISRPLLSKENMSYDETFQLVDHITQQCSIDHISTFRRLVTLCNQRSLSSCSNHFPFWMSPKLQEWQESSEKALILVKGTFKDRFALRQLCVNIVQQLLSKAIAVLYILLDEGKAHTLHDVFKSLIAQALSLHQSVHLNPTLTPHLRELSHFHSDAHYLSCLTDILAQFPHVYIVVNAEAIVPESALDFRKALRELNRILASRSVATKVHILTTSQTPTHTYDVTVDDQILRLDSTRTRLRLSAARLRTAGQKRPNDQHDLFGGLARTSKRVSWR